MDDRTLPWRLLPNKMNTYEGGREIDRFRGVPVPLDDHRPEGWIGSTTTFRSKAHPRLGHSEVLRPSGGTLYLTDAIREDPVAMTGGPDGFGALMKLLDAGQDLMVQCHPTREAALEVFGSPFGKAESWIVLGARPDAEEPPHVLLGFREGVDPDRFYELYAAKRAADIEAMLHRFDVVPGDVFMVPPGVPHAVHVGCLLVEVQEPSDITVNLLPYTWGTPETNRAHDLAVRRCVVFEGRTREETERALRVRPTVLRDGPWGVEESLIGPAQTPYFACTRLTLRGSAPWRPTGRGAACLVVSGSGAIHHPDGAFSLRKADEFFLPAAARDLRFSAGPDGLVVVAAHPEGAELA